MQPKRGVLFAGIALTAAASAIALDRTDSPQTAQKSRPAGIVVLSPEGAKPQWIEATGDTLRARLRGWATVVDDDRVGWRVRPASAEVDTSVIGWLAAASGDMELSVVCLCPGTGEKLETARAALPRTVRTALCLANDAGAIRDGSSTFLAADREQAVTGDLLADASLGELHEGRRSLALSFNQYSASRFASLTATVHRLQTANVDAHIALLVDRKLVAIAESVDEGRRQVAFDLRSRTAEAVHRLCLEGTLPVTEPLVLRIAD